MGGQTNVNTATLSFKAGADLSALQYRFVKITAERTVDKTTAATDQILGVLQNDPALDEGASVLVGGLSKQEAGGVIAAGDEITSDSVGRGVKATPAAGVNNNLGGWAITPAAALGDIYTLFVIPQKIQGS